MNSHAYLKVFDTWQSSRKNPRDTSCRRTLQNIFLDDSLMSRTASHSIIFFSPPINVIWSIQWPKIKVLIWECHGKNFRLRSGVTNGLESFTSWTLGQAHGSGWQDFQLQWISTIKPKGILTSKKFLTFKIKLGIIQKFILSCNIG